MKKIVLLVVGLFLFTVNISWADGLPLVIGGYNNYQYNLEPEQEQKLKNFIGKIQAKKISDEQLQFNIDGHSSINGMHLENVELSRKRAEEVREYLRRYFPNAKYSFLSKGDRENERRVDVECILPNLSPVATVMPKTQKTPELKDAIFNLLAYLVVGIIALGLLLFFVIRSAKNKKTILAGADQGAEVRKAEIVKEEGILRDVTANDKDGEAIIVKVKEYRDKQIVTPLKFDGKPMTCPNYQIAKKKVREHCKKFSATELCAQGVLKK